MNSVFLLPFLFGIGSFQFHHSLLGGIPAKIHYDIFGTSPRLQMSFVNSPSLFPQTNLSPNSPYTHEIRVAHPNQVGYRTSLLQNLRNNGTVKRIPTATDLFSPAIVKTPVATKGQIEAYRKALEEEAKREQKENMEIENNKYLVPDLEPKALSYVSVRLGGSQNVNYQYNA